MNTTQFITTLMEESGNVVNRGQMLNYVNLAQKKIFGLNTWFNRTKPDPYLDTTSGTQSYTMGDSVRSVTRIYKSTTTGGYGEKSNQKECDVDFLPTIATSIESSTGNAVVYFVEDPGTTTDEYQLEQYEWPDDLTSEAIALSVDEVTADEYLRYLVHRRLEEAGYGQSLYNDKQVEDAKQDFFLRVKQPASSLPSKNRGNLKGRGNV